MAVINSFAWNSVSGDRKYNAENLMEYFALFVGNGVFQKTGNALRVVAKSSPTGLQVDVLSGACFMNGRGASSNTTTTLTLNPAHVTLARRDRVVARFNYSTRLVEIIVLEGTAASSPVAPSIVRTDSYKYLSLAEVLIPAGASTITQSQIVDTRADSRVCGFVTGLVDQLDTTNINAQWNANMEQAIANMNATFTTWFNSVKAELTSIDVVDLIERIKVLETKGKYEYICTGTDDNIAISNLVNGFLSAGTDYSSCTIKVSGTFGASRAVSGAGTEASPYRWFTAGLGSRANRRVILDFTDCSFIDISCPSNTTNVIFFGMEAFIKGVNIRVTGSGARITMFSTSGESFINAENCRFWLTADSGYIARGGSFKNCRVSLTTNGSGNVFPVTSAGLLRVEGGEYYAYSASGVSAVIYVGASDTDAVVITYGMNCPTSARSGYVQSSAINCLSSSAKCSFTDTITTLPVSAAGQNVRGTIASNKPNLY